MTTGDRDHRTQASERSSAAVPVVIRCATFACATWRRWLWRA